LQIDKINSQLHGQITCSSGSDWPPFFVIHPHKWIMSLSLAFQCQSWT